MWLERVKTISFKQHCCAGTGREGGRNLGPFDVCKHTLARHVAPRRCHQVDHFTSFWLKVQQSYPSSRSFHDIWAQGTTAACIKSSASLHPSSKAAARVSMTLLSPARRCIAVQSAPVVSMTLLTPPRWQSATVARSLWVLHLAAERLPTVSGKPALHRQSLGAEKRSYSSMIPSG